MKKLKITGIVQTPPAPAPAAPEQRICEYPGCRKPFTPTVRNRGPHKQRYCDTNCRYRHWCDRNPRINQLEKLEELRKQQQGK